MNSKFWLLVLGGLLLGLGGCGSGLLGRGGLPPISSVAPVLSEHPLYKAPYSLSRNEAPLVARYYWINEVSNNNSTRDEANYDGMKYQPRQSKYQGYEGWDVLDIPGWLNTKSRSDWLRIYLNRPTTLVVVWDKTDLWLSGWKKGSISISGKSYTTYTRDFDAGEIGLGTPGTGQGDNYFVLLAERGGTPSKEPALPAGITDKPLPNQSCPSWLENAWTIKQMYGVTAPDGEDYKTWHPQVDPIYWCYYGHDHGSDPALVGYKPAFEFVAKRFNDQPELHVGFKGFAIRDEGANQGWYINIHSETGVQTRACAQFHTVVVAVMKLSTSELLAELAYKGNFGATISNQNDTAANLSCTDPKSGQPKTQTQIKAETDSAKNLRISSNGNDPGGYENWHGGGNKGLGMSFWGDEDPFGRALNIDIRNPTSFCADGTCSSVRSTGSVADERTISISNLRIRYTDAIATLDKADGTQDGYFWTDLYGGPLPAGKNPGDPGTIRQFIKPGFDSGTGGDGLQGGFSTEDAWRGVYLRDMGVPRIGLEDALTGQN
jgi:hypothetical protein